MHTRVAPKGTLLDPGHYDDVVADVTGFLHERMAVAIARGVDPEQLLLDPGPDFAKTPAQTVAVLRRLEDVLALGRPVMLAISNKDFVGAVTGRAAARAARRRRWPRSHTGWRRAPTSCASTTSPPRRTSCACVPLCAGISSSRPRMASPPTATLTECKGLPAAAHNAAGCQPTTHLKGTHHVRSPGSLRAGAEPARRPSPAGQRARRRRLPPPPQGRADRRDRRAPVGRRRTRGRGSRGRGSRGRSSRGRGSRGPPRLPRRTTRPSGPAAGAGAAAGAAAAARRAPPTRTPATTAPSRAPRTRTSRASSSCSPTAPASSASRRPSRPTTTSTSRPPRSSAASWSRATGSAAPSAPRAAPSASRR